MDRLAEYLPPIITGLFLFYWQWLQTKRDKKRAEREQLKEEREIIRDEIEDATMELSYATAMAWKLGHPNGEVEAALKFYNKAKADKEKYDREVKSKLLK